jgi:hypothetical protein
MCVERATLNVCCRGKTDFEHSQNGVSLAQFVTAMDNDHLCSTSNTPARRSIFIRSIYFLSLFADCCRLFFDCCGDCSRPHLTRRSLPGSAPSSNSTPARLRMCASICAR